MKNTLFRIIKVVKKHAGMYTIGALGVAAIGTYRQLIIAWILKDLFDAAASRNLRALLISIAWGLFIVAVQSVLRPVFQFLLERSVLQSVGELKKSLYIKIMRLPIDYFNHEHSGNITSKLTNDIKEIEGALITHLVNLFYFVVCLICVIVVMFGIDFWLAIVALITGAIALALNAAFTRPLRDVSRKIQKNLGFLVEKLSDLLAGMRVTKAFNLYRIITGKFEHVNKSVLKISLKKVRLSALLASTNDFGKMLDIIGVMGIGAYFAIQGKVSVGSIIAMWQLKSPVLMIFNQLGDIIANIQTSIAAAERVFSYFDIAEELATYDSLKTSTQVEGSVAVRVEDVEFGYRSKEKVLEGISFEIKKGQKVAIVGPSGEGKSTIFKLLLGFYPSQNGSIVIDGGKLTTGELNELRKTMAYVPQDAYLFSGTVMENIRFGRVDATEEEIIHAAKLANAHDFITAFEEGYNTWIGERGAQLSGGQRQRIGIARAILRNAPILLLDEATSAVDVESEYLIQQSLDRLAKERTVLIVTHRLSAIKDVDKIIVLENGRLREEGTHAELMAMEDGLYRSMYQQQFDNLQDVEGLPKGA